MLKSCGSWLMHPVGHQSLRGAVILVVVSGALLWDPHGLTATRAVAQVEGPTGASAPASGNSATVNTEDDADAGVDGKGATRRESSESFLTSIAHASTPVIVVTLVIATM